MIWTQKLITAIKGQGHRCRWKYLKIKNKKNKIKLSFNFS
jgi:hypothetical protein